MSSNVVRDWLMFLDAEKYAESFIDNGYDDLETIKLIEREDLVAIGVKKQEHQDHLLSSVQVLKEKGAAWVYLLDCEANDNSNDKLENESDYCDKNYYGSSGPESYKSSTYQTSDGTVSEESHFEERKYKESSINNCRDRRDMFRQGKLIK